MSKKKKQNKALIAGVGVLAALVAVEVGLNYANNKAENADETEGVNPLSVSSEDVTEVTVTNKYGTFSLIKSDDAWSNRDDADFPLDEDAWTDKLSGLDDLTVSRTLENTEDLSEYGLDEPAVTLTLTTEDGETTVCIGDQNSSTSDYYIYVGDDSSTVYTVGSTLPKAMNCKLYDLAVSSDFPDITSGTLTDISIKTNEDTIDLTNQGAGSSTTSWTVSKNGGDSNSADSSTITDLKDAMEDLDYDEFVNYNASDLSEYGLDDPWASVTWDYTTTETRVVEKETEAETDAESEEESAAETDTEADTAADTEGETAAETESETKEAGISASISGTEAETETTAAETETESETETEEETETETYEVAHEVVLLIGDPIYAETDADETETETETAGETETQTAEAESSEGETGEIEETESETETEGTSAGIEGYYVKLSDSDEVYTMDADTLEEWIGSSYISFVDRSISTVPMTSMESLTVTYNEEEYELTVESEVQIVEPETEPELETESETGDAESETETEVETESETETEIVYRYRVNGYSKDETLFETFYGEAIAMEAQTLLEEADVSGDPDFELVFKKDDGTSVTAEYYLGNDGMYTVITSSGLTGKVSKLTVGDMIESFEALIKSSANS